MINTNFDFKCECGDTSAVLTITLGELIEGGLFDYKNDESLKFDYYSEEQFLRFCEKFVNRFYFREISVTPYAAWKRAYMRKINEIMPKYKPLYKALDEGQSILSIGDTYEQAREIYNEFPQTALNNNQDYATSGHDSGREVINTGDFVDKVQDIVNKYNDIDVCLLNEVEVLFSSLFTVHVNGI